MSLKARVVFLPVSVYYIVCVCVCVCVCVWMVGWVGVFWWVRVCVGGWVGGWVCARVRVCVKRIKREKGVEGRGWG